MQHAKTIASYFTRRLLINTCWASPIAGWMIGVEVMYALTT